MPAMQRTEPFDIRTIRNIFRHWPFPRGKGLLLKTFSPFLRNREFVFDVADGVLVPSDMDDWITLHGFVDGYDADFAKSWALIRPGGIVFDIGANIGIWAIAAARRVGTGGAVHAFEPFAENFSRLTANIELNRALNIIPQQLALMDHPGSLKFFPSPNKNSGVGRVVADDWKGPHCAVKAATLDDYCEQHAVASVDLLKLDVEGSEHFVLKGATRLLASKKPPTIIFEVERVMTLQLNYLPEDLETFLHSFGYSIHALRAGKWQPISLMGFVGPEDLLAIPPIPLPHHF
jgi:FkbM family methyltransferase